MKNENTDLESEYNELEIMEFTINGETFGVSSNKVNEIMKYSSAEPIPDEHPAIEGLFKPRDEMIIIVDLAAYLHLPPSSDKKKDILIITEVNKNSFAFHVHTVVGIDRITKNKIQSPDNVSYGGKDEITTIGIAEYENRLITLLNFEKIISEICPELCRVY